MPVSVNYPSDWIFVDFMSTGEIQNGNITNNTLYSVSSYKDWLLFCVSVSIVYMVDLQVIKESLRQEGIGNGYAEGSLSVSELTENIANVFDNQNQSGSREGSIDVSLASELVLNWILNVYDPWVQIKYY